jgi:hypothetical protein
MLAKQHKHTITKQQSKIYILKYYEQWLSQSVATVSANERKISKKNYNDYFFIYIGHNYQ